MAVTNMEQMLAFYKEVFKVDFEEKQMFGSTLYSGEFAGLHLLFCPNEIAKVQAQKNRQQLDVIVPNVEQIIKAAKLFVGSQLGEVTDKEKQRVAAIIDPDGNSIVVKQNL